MFTIKESGNFNSDVPAGTYPSTLEAVSTENISSDFGADQQMWEFHFLANVNGELKPVSGLATQRTSQKAKARKWLTALLRRELQVGEQIEAPVGAQALVVVGPNTRGNMTVIDVLPAPTPPEQTQLPDGSSVPR